MYVSIYWFRFPLVVVVALFLSPQRKDGGSSTHDELIWPVEAERHLSSFVLLAHLLAVIGF